MATLGDALAALSKQIKLDKLEPLLGNGQTPARPAAPLTQASVPPVGADAAGEAVHAEQTPARTSNAPATTHPSQPAHPPASAQTRLSADAALITQLLSSAPQQQGAARVAFAAVDASALPPTQLANVLAAAVSESGVFYESHLQQWVAGERSLELLRREPHNRLPQDAPPPRTNADTVRVPLDGARTMTQAEPATGGGSSSPAPGTASAPAPAPVPEALAPVVREQLDAIDLRRVQWQGEVWPQQQAQLEIAEDGARREYEHDETSAVRSTLRLDLPNLGPVEVRITFDGAGVAVQMHAKPESLEALRPGRAAFAENLREAGIALRQLELQGHE